MQWRISYYGFTLHNYADDRPTLENINYIIEEVEQWEEIGFYMKDRSAQNKFQEIKTGCKDSKQQRRRMWEDWQKFYPKVSRVVLYQSLLYVRQHAVARKVLSKRFLRGESHVRSYCIYNGVAILMNALCILCSKIYHNYVNTINYFCLASRL